MMDYTEKIKFPLLDLSIRDWTKIYDLPEILWEDLYIYSSSNKNFKLHLLNHILVDDMGNLFKIKAKENLPFLNRLVPFGKKAKVVLESLDKTISFNEVKDIVLSNISKLKTDGVNEDFIDTWCLNVKKSETILDMFLPI